jgi:hypothetical protein
LSSLSSVQILLGIAQSRRGEFFGPARNDQFLRGEVSGPTRQNFV